MDRQLLEFDLNDIPDNPAIVCCGVRRAGKGVMTKDIVYNYFRGKVKSVYLFSPTCNISDNPMDFVPFENRYDNVDIEVMERLMKRQEHLINNNPKGDYRILFIIDDCLSSTDNKQKNMINKLFVIARHFQISLIVNYQYIKRDFNPIQRSNTDIIFVFSTSNFDNKDTINNQYLSISNDKKSGLRLIDTYARNYQVLVISNTINSSSYEDFCFYYSADIINKKFKLGRDYD